ncbi:UreD-domain-containing protein [Gloeophyllum trabeum ATCC 11539]|uniref:UreD-domain-containing protein n=1 Tax=Gloeophyllum trabeum (strain ATCC 11539 / FP-39264 / Madison 617) TaxID=670483 RepID=S7RZT3_GLOTA|nr:UreD-domain-containing protein [Gloeophyllum trabeum ATCC 11539]EPQ60545.1 UreD-domain-containing protein [Gloeophyllum trabeum ATCC 11539]
MASTAITVGKIDAGVGRIVLRLHGSSAVFSELSSTYPLKLLSPRIEQDGVAVVYNMSYGGGLVGGDRIQLSVDIGSGASLVVLTQASRGSTKVFKTRPGARASTRNASEITEQRMTVSVADGGAIFLLPDPVTCFRAASYNQLQAFHLARGASAVLLDWVTAGRKSLGEEWSFARYYSLNEVVVEGKRVARDVMCLEEQGENAGPLERRTLCERLAPYSCYATVILWGPLVDGVVTDLEAAYRDITVFRRNAPPSLLWSLSPLVESSSSRQGRIVRVAGKETEQVKHWLADALRALEEVIGTDVYRKAFV